jgi:hypothetical protein
MPELLAFFGFIVAAYAIVANDSIQTLGTFLSSNSHRPWWLLWLYACSILVSVMVYGWFVHFGDIAYGRLTRFPEPAAGISWIHAVPPVFILLLTRFGVPVSTTFLILTVFAPANLGHMLVKSLFGYTVAIGVGLGVYLLVSRFVEAHFLRTQNRPVEFHWVIMQWLSTAFLWSQWLIQDLANIFVYLPRKLDAELLIVAVLIMLALHAIIFRNRGGRIQAIVTSKTNTGDIRAATIIDLIYGCMLLYFKELSNVPMSTTWVFLGLLAGRELAMSFMMQHRTIAASALLAVKDAGKALIGLLVSIALALGLPMLDRAISGDSEVAAEDAPRAREQLASANLSVRRSDGSLESRGKVP